MTKKTFFKALSFVFILLVFGYSVYGQEVPIIDYSTDSNGQVQLKVNTTSQHYYVLKVRHHTDSLFEIATSMTLGKADSTLITEALGHYPLDHYKVLEFPIASPFDTDDDGIDDITEYQNTPSQNPLNPAKSIPTQDGSIRIDNMAAFESLSVTKDFVKWSDFLNGKEFVKFIIVDFNTKPQVYFINSSNHDLHNDFAIALGLDYLGDHVKKGQVIYHPKSVSNNGTLGTFAFNYSNGHAQDFEVVQKTHELLGANMPFIQNNLAYFITENNEEKYNEDTLLYQNSRIPVLLESEIYSGLDYWGLNVAEGYGFFRQVTLEEIPGAKEIVLYESLPNTLPRVAGIMTSVVQTPLSHVNLRAIQNDIPNAFIRNPLDNDTIANLLDDYIYYRVERDHFIIRKATLEEVNKWYENIRPKEDQDPPLNLSYTKILPLSEIEFTMSDGYGAKCTNVATMLSFGFPDKTIPDGFGVPFYYYQEFMKFNNFFENIKAMVSHPDFIADRSVRNDMLKAFRKKIENAAMPDWMLDELAAMQASFPPGTSIRCRSSSNNEDLSGFNGAGLYDSKTQKPSEGHISKSIKEVYASLWNLRAFEEREFYRLNQFMTSMGVLCHPNYKDEKANGVGVSADPVYQTKNTFYLNTQLGEDLITNPNALSVPEEILLDRETVNGFIVIEHSNLIPKDSAIMSEFYLNQMRIYLTKIHSEFERLYAAENDTTFAMDIEYKITSDDQLIIKQARPWVSYSPVEESITDDGVLDLHVYPNPAQNQITVQCRSCKLSKVIITNALGQQFQEKPIAKSNGVNHVISIEDLSAGVYFITGFTANNARTKSSIFIKIGE